MCAFLRVMCVYFGGVFVLGCGQGWWLGCVMCGRAGQWAGLLAARVEGGLTHRFGL